MDRRRKSTLELKRSKETSKVYLDTTHQSLLADLAQRLGISQAAVLRRGLEHLAREVIPLEEDPAMKLIGLAGKDTNSLTDPTPAH
jgi:predicted ArsR family transcriptional regulator